MSKNAGCLKNLWQGLERIVITQRIQSETAVCNGSKNSARTHQRQWEVSFSARKALSVAAVVLTGAAVGILLWKKNVEAKLLCRLKKKYFFLPADRVNASEKEEQEG